MPLLENVQEEAGCFFFKRLLLLRVRWLTGGRGRPLWKSPRFSGSKHFKDSSVVIKTSYQPHFLLSVNIFCTALHNTTAHCTTQHTTAHITLHTIISMHHPLTKKTAHKSQPPYCTTPLHCADYNAQPCSAVHTAHCTLQIYYSTLHSVQQQGKRRGKRRQKGGKRR